VVGSPQSHKLKKTNAQYGIACVFKLSRQHSTGKTMSVRVSERLFRVLLRIAFVFEPLAQPAISYYLTRRLNKLKNQGKIGEYKTRTRRTGKFYYTVEIDLDLTGEQAFHVVDDMLPKQVKHLRR
jgi:hypothetical protein